ncbi:23S rRNA (uracil(1939)-C(5))-methyltransferase RlmD [Clostridium oryzae]|uniref:23S rRNA (Uracil-C(5))-methyltransferase RlmCD n=1 Tax=Clostridium oryzae TaxID=1450648 RepID=A0A1V4IZ22_9CLOT|nr:23S rRNA (uracil(1939)-C(5))-methyltransferase RlmD [Clostridium oryzae]OPJ65149.1 23S rRNA (uracil-C(5))-methyltransferase RlmCD [Clostridium oryzae]
MNLEKNQELILDIVSEGYEGEGVAKPDGFPIFVEGALKGEKVKVKIVRLNKSHGFGKLLEIVEKSPSRIEPVCPIYKRCGGCGLQHMDYKEQLRFKTDRVRDCVERIGKVSGAVIHDAIGMENPYRYRNKVQLPVGNLNGQNLVGFYAARSHEIVDINKCYIQDEIADKVIQVTKLWMKEFKIAAYDEKKRTGVLRHVMVRKGFKTGEVMVVLVTNGKKLPCKQELITLLAENIEGIKSIIQNINSQKTNVILGLENKTLWGSDNITDYIGKFKFNISPVSFFQVNPVQTEVLYGKALEYAGMTGNEIVFDAYCGTGTITLFLSQKAQKVYGVEIIPEAIENAKENARLNGVDNVEFFVGESEVVIPDMIKKGIKADVVVVDPPRKGCEASLLMAISDMAPKKIVYVSCNPATLARDLQLLEEKGYKTKEVQPVDMFPWTGHVECVVLMSRV